MMKFEITPMGYSDNTHYIEGSSCLDAINNFDKWLKENRYWQVTEATQLTDNNWHIIVKGISEKSCGFAIYDVLRCQKED